MHSAHDYSADRRIYSSWPRRKATPERIEKMRQMTTARWKDKSYRERTSLAIKNGWTLESRRRMSEKTIKRMANPEWREFCSKRASKMILEGRLWSGTAKWYRYKKISGETILVQGTYELRTAKALDENGHVWARNTDRFFYRDIDGSEHHYTPDFKIFTGAEPVYLEVKGYFGPKDFVKMYDVSVQSSIKLYFLFKEDIVQLEKGKDVFTEERALLNVVSLYAERFADGIL
jgi:predicted nuclease of restriction endonuclease-like RecB superfamily